MNWMILISGLAAGFVNVGHFTVGSKDFLKPISLHLRIFSLIIYCADRNRIGIQLRHGGCVAGKIHCRQLFFLCHHPDCHCGHFKHPKWRDQTVSMDLFYRCCDFRLDRRILIFLYNRIISLIDQYRKGIIDAESFNYHHRNYCGYWRISGVGLVS